MDNTEIKRQKLVYDIRSKPLSLEFANMVKMYDQHNIIIWDSSLGGTKPALFGVDDEKSPLLLIDTEGKDIDISSMDARLRDEEYWDKEVYRCQMSPVYYWSNYGTPVYPAPAEDLQEYLVSLGLKQLATQTDGDKAKEAWEAQKDKVKEAMEFITREHLEERKGVVDSLKHLYDEKVNSLEKKLSAHVSLFDGDGVPLPDGKRKENITKKIRQVKYLPVLPKYSEDYRNKNGKWDGSMLYATGYDVLLQIFDEVLENHNSK